MKLIIDNRKYTKLKKKKVNYYMLYKNILTQNFIID